MIVDVFVCDCDNGCMCVCDCDSGCMCTGLFVIVDVCVLFVIVDVCMYGSL